MFHNSARDQGKSGRGTVERRKRRRWMRPTVVVLEDRRLLSTLTVTNNASSGAGSLPYEIGLANTAGGANTIVFGSFFNTPQTITLGGTQLELSTANESVTITGPAAGVTVSGNNASRVFEVDGGVTASISGLTISGGNTTGDGGGLANFGTTTLNNCTVSGNSAGFFGGGGMYNGGTLTTTNCTASGNSADFGGGVLNGNPVTYQAGTLMMTNCTVSGNSGFVGGLDASGAPVMLTNTIIAGNGGADIFAGVVGGTGPDAPSLSGTNNLIGTGSAGAANEWGQRQPRRRDQPVAGPSRQLRRPHPDGGLAAGKPGDQRRHQRPRHPHDRPTRPGPGWRRRYRRLRESGFYSDGCCRQQPPNFQHWHGVRQPAGRKCDGQQSGRAGERRCCHIRRQAREHWRLGVLSGLVGRRRQRRHRQRPGRRHRRSQQRGWIIPGRGVGLGLVIGHLQSHEHRPGLHSPDREYDERFSLPGSWPVEPARSHRLRQRR